MMLKARKAVFVSFGAVSFAVGSFLLSKVGEVTGYSVYDSLSENMRYFVGANFIVLSFLLFLAAKDWVKYRAGVQVSVEDFESGLNPVETALRINKELGKAGYSVTGVDYRGDNRDTIKFEAGDLDVRLKEREKAKDLALALYEVALMNNSDNTDNSKIYLSRYASNESHPEGFKRAVYEFELAYGKELESMRKRFVKKRVKKKKTA